MFDASVGLSSVWGRSWWLDGKEHEVCTVPPIFLVESRPLNSSLDIVLYLCLSGQPGQRRW